MGKEVSLKSIRPRPRPQSSPQIQVKVRLARSVSEHTHLLPAHQLPIWFKYPAGVRLLVSRGTVDFVLWRFPETPWALATYAHLKGRYQRELFPVAWRVGTDDYVCLEQGSGDTLKIINGYAPKGHESHEEFVSFWDWFRYAVEEVIEMRGDDPA